MEIDDCECVYISQNLDALHDHLGTLYPGMRAPSFRCTEEADGSLILHYYSDRPGLEHIVIGIVKVSTIANQLFIQYFIQKKMRNRFKVNIISFCTHFPSFLLLFFTLLLLSWIGVLMPLPISSVIRSLNGFTYLQHSPIHWSR